MPADIRVLIIDDNREQSELMRRHLVMAGSRYICETVMTAGDARERLTDRKFDVILMDYHLPGTNGLDLFREIKPDIRDAAVIFVTAAGNEAIAVEAMKEGAYDYMTKDVQRLRELPRVVERVFDKAVLERELERSRRHYSGLFQNAQNAILLVDPAEFMVLDANKRAAELFAMRPEQLKGGSFLEFCASEEISKARRGLARAAQTSEPFMQGLFLLRQRTDRWEAELTAHRIESGSQPVLLCQIRDLTETRRLEEQIIASKMRLQTLFDGVSDMISVQNESYEIMMVNKPFARWAGAAPDELVGQKCYKAYFGRETPCERCPLPAAFANSAKKEVEVSHDDEILSITGVSMPGYQGETRVAIEQIRLITESRRLEKNLLHSEKLAAIGILSSGIAHELRNPLNIIEAARYYLADKIPDSESDYHSKLKIIKTNVGRSARIINNLLEFSRRGTGERVMTDLSQLIVATLSLIEKELKHRQVEIVRDFEPELCAPVDREGIRHIILNLAMNGLAAMQNGGKLTFTTYTSAENKAIIEVEDTGKGIPQQEVKHIFTPFYTSKPVGEGTGLGLHIANIIISKHNGAIRVLSEEGIGTTFIIELPLGETEPQVESGMPSLMSAS